MAPSVPRKGPYRFHFYSDERGEPPHIHVACGDGECKFWLEPVVLAGNRNLPAHAVREIERVVFENCQFLLECYREYHRR